MWTVLKLSSGRFEVYKEEDGNTVMTYPETFGSPEEAKAKAEALNNKVEPEPVNGVAQTATPKPVDSVQAPAPAADPVPATDPTPASDPVPSTDADPSADADESKSDADADPSASPADASGATPSAASSDPAPADSGTGTPTGEPAV